MHFTPTFKILPVVALLATAFGASAASNTSWAPTRTYAHDAGSAVRGYAMLPGELVRVTVSLELRNEDRLDARVAAIMAGHAARHLTSEEFMRDHAPSAAQVKAVVDHLRKSGFVNVAASDNRMLVSADGSAATVKLAFNTELHHFNVDGRDAYANAGDAQVPRALSGIVKAVLGLQTVDMARTMLQQPDVTTAVLSGHSPTEFSGIYNANGLAAATGTRVGIIAQGSMTQTLTDLSTFVAQAGFATPSVSVVTVGAASTDSSNTIEWDLDSQDALSAAGGALQQIVFYVATTLSDADLTATYNRAVSDNLTRAVNVSLGECEKTARNSGTEATQDAIFKTAVAQGQTFSVSSGDSGAFQCFGHRKTSQSYPAVSPYVIAVGGTSLTAPGGVYGSETTWSGTGGGISITEAAPAAQIASGVLGTSTRRGVPDIAFDADPNSGAIIVFKGGHTQVGGTSLSAPLFAGFWARIQSAHANTLIFPAAALYQYGPTNPSLFHDITSGSNGGFSAAVGWDYTTGFGSLNVGNFAAFVATHPGF